MYIVVIIAGIGCAAAGVLAYRGRWTNWAHISGYSHGVGFSFLFLGGALITAGIFMGLPHTALTPGLLLYVTAPLIGCSIICYWWLPPFLLPAWFREAREKRRAVERSLADLRRTAQRLRRIEKIQEQLPEGDRGAATERDHTSHDVTVLTAATPLLAVSYTHAFEVDEAADIEGADLVLVATQAGLIFRPTIVFTSTPSDAPLVDASMTASLAVHERYEGGRVISVDAVLGPSITGDPVGRRIVFTYALDNGLEILVKKWVYATGTHHLHMSASYLASQAPYLDRTIEWIADNITFAADTGAIAAAAVSVSGSGVELDEAATATDRTAPAAGSVPV